MKSSWSGILAALAVTLTLTACGTSQQNSSATEATTQNQTMTSADHQTTKHEMPYDAEFLDMMGYHHQHAVMMAREALDKSQMSQVRKLAQSIITDQEAEIEHMKSLRIQWYPKVPVMTMDDAMKQMKQFDLSQGTGSFDKRFLEAMIDHHQEALKMTDEAGSKAEHAELKKMAEAMNLKQEKEIGQMQRMEEMARR